MKVIGCNSVPVVKVVMTVDIIAPLRGNAVSIREASTGNEFQIWVPKRIAEQIKVGEELVVLCIPSSDFSMSLQTIAVYKRRGSLDVPVYTSSGHLYDLWDKTGV